MCALFAAALATLLFTLQAFEMPSALVRFGFFWAATLYIHDAVATPSATLPTNTPHIYRCPEPLELWITLENSLERRSFPGFACGDPRGLVSIESEVATPGHDIMTDGNYRMTPTGLSPNAARRTWVTG